MRKRSNKVRTSRYTPLSWAPMSLLMQFKRAANIYFLWISILTLMPFSPKTPAPMIGTFTMVLVFTMLKELYEDIGRWKSDKELNNKTSLVYNNGKWEPTYWKDIKVGDTCKIIKDEDFPADLLLTNSEKDLVFVDTMNLDGETNLKERLIPFSDHI